MQDYVFNPLLTFNAIYIRWAIGYLARDEQIAFLKKAQSALKNPDVLVSRRRGPESYIILMDNIDDGTKRKKPISHKGQVIQSEQYYEQLFKDAGLLAFKEHTYELNDLFFGTKVWALI